MMSPWPMFVQSLKMTGFKTKHINATFKFKSINIIFDLELSPTGSPWSLFVQNWIENITTIRPYKVKVYIYDLDLSHLWPWKLILNRDDYITLITRRENLDTILATRSKSINISFQLLWSSNWSIGFMTSPWPISTNLPRQYQCTWACTDGRTRKQIWSVIILSTLNIML